MRGAGLPNWGGLTGAGQVAVSFWPWLQLQTVHVLQGLLQPAAGWWSLARALAAGSTAAAAQPVLCGCNAQPGALWHKPALLLLFLLLRLAGSLQLQQLLTKMPCTATGTAQMTLRCPTHILMQIIGALA